MKELWRELTGDMDREDWKECIEGLLAFGSLFWLCFMMSVVTG